MEIVYLRFSLREILDKGDEWLPYWGDHLNPEAWCPECQISQAQTYDVCVPTTEVPKEIRERT